MTDSQRAAMQAALEALELATTPLAKAKQFSGTQLRIDPVTGNVGIGTVALSEPTCKDDLQDAEPDEIGPEWTPCVKRPVTVHVREQRVGEAHVSTREGITPVKPDDLIMRGVDGEEYPIGRDLFNRTYLVGVARIKQVTPRREWVGLTEEEIEAAWKSCDPKKLLPSFAAAIEAALKEKNRD